jgi:protein required for attachment to host cells
MTSSTSKLKLHPGEWVVVCDGAKALVLENIGDAKFPNLKTREVRVEKHPPTRAEGSDAPGRVQPSVGTARSAVEQTDWHEQDERRFLTALAAHLDRAVLAGEAKSLIVVAPPRALGILREAYSRHLKAAIREEISKDLVKLPVYEIEKNLVG